MVLRNNNKAVVNNNEAIKLSKVCESEKCLPCLTRKWFCFLAFEGPQLLTVRTEIGERSKDTLQMYMADREREHAQTI